MYSTVKRARDVRKALREQNNVPDDVFKMLEALRDDDYIPTDTDELKMVLRMGVHSWQAFSKEWEDADAIFDIIQKTAISV